MGKLFLAAMHRPVSTARAISLVITISTGIRSKRRATHAAWRLPSAESGVCTCWYARFSLPSVDPCRTKYTVFIAVLLLVPKRRRPPDHRSGGVDPRSGKRRDTRVRPDG